MSEGNERAVPHPLRGILETVFNASAFSRSWKEELRQWQAADPMYETLIRKQLADALQNNTISVEQYNKLTDEKLGSAVAVKERLLQIWRELYPEEEITG